MKAEYFPITKNTHHTDSEALTQHASLEPAKSRQILSQQTHISVIHNSKYF